MTQYMISGSTIFLGDERDMTVSGKLPVGTYTVSFNRDMGTYFLSMVPDFTTPSKLYGEANAHAERFLNTFSMRDGTTGILLLGLKGSGKSLTLRKASQLGLAAGIPTIIVPTPYHDQGFFKFLQSIEEPAILVFDEFEKVYNDLTHQEALLTLLDGTFTTKKMVIMTANDENKISRHMINRPGRLFYHIKYTCISNQFIMEYCQDKLEDKSKINSICRVAALIGDFNFDMLQALVEELNRYKESVSDALRILNVKMDRYNKTVYVVSIKDKNGVELEKKDFSPTTVGNPLISGAMNFEVYPPEDDEKVVFVLFMPDHTTVKVSSDLSEIKFESSGYFFTLSKLVPKEFDYANYY